MLQIGMELANMPKPTETSVNDPAHDKLKSKIRKLGIGQIVGGSVCILLGLIDIGVVYGLLSKYPVFRYKLQLTGVGLWSSPLTIISGLLSLKIGSEKCTIGTIRGNLIVLLFALFLEISGIVTSGISASANIDDGLKALLSIICITEIINLSMVFISYIYCFRLNSDLTPDVAQIVVVQQPGVVMAQQPGVAMAQQPGVVMAQQPGVVMAQQPGVVMAQQPGVVMAQQPGTLNQQAGAIMTQQATGGGTTNLGAEYQTKTNLAYVQTDEKS